MASLPTEKSYKDVKTVKFGEHLIFDAYGCNPEKLGNMEVCYDALNKMVELAEMKKLTEPSLIKAEGNEVLGGKDPGGYSGFVIIEESHVSLHSFVKRGFITIDLYSCKPFPSDAVVQYLRETFEPKEDNVLKMERGLKYPADNIYP